MSVAKGARFSTPAKLKLSLKGFASMPFQPPACILSQAFRSAPKIPARFAGNFT